MRPLFAECVAKGRAGARSVIVRLKVLALVTSTLTVEYEKTENGSWEDDSVDSLTS